jgi:hypothetical protein
MASLLHDRTDLLAHAYRYRMMQQKKNLAHLLQQMEETGKRCKESTLTFSPFARAPYSKEGNL